MAFVVRTGCRPAIHCRCWNPAALKDLRADRSAMSASMIATLLLGFGASCLFVWTLMPVARRIGLVDQPGGRKTHDGAVPRRDGDRHRGDRHGARPRHRGTGAHGVLGRA